MPTITKKTVMDQTSGPEGQVSCGVHTFKNMLLTMLLNNNSITSQQYGLLIKNSDFFNVIYNKFHEQGLKTRELLTSDFYEAVEKISIAIKSESLDLTAHGISKEALKEIDLANSPQAQFSVGSYIGGAGAVEPELGTMAGVTDLLTAGAIAKFTRSQGPSHHIFAMGDLKFAGNGHWVTVIAHKSNDGSYKWDSLDSWHNQNAFSKGIIQKIEPLLNKSEPELQTYLRTAYDNRLDRFTRRVDNFFDDKGTLKEGYLLDVNNDGHLIVDAKGFFLGVDLDGSKESALSLIEEATVFFESAGWLENPSAEEITRINKVLSVAKYMHSNADEITQKEVIETLKPIIDKLGLSITNDVALNVEPTIALTDNIAEASPIAQNMEVKQDVNPLVQQNIEAIHAVEHGEPQVTTPNLFDRLVSGLANLYEGIKSTISSMADYVATAIGVR